MDYSTSLIRVDVAASVRTLVDENDRRSVTADLKIENCRLFFFPNKL